MQIVIYLGNQSCQLCNCDRLRVEHRSTLNTNSGVLLDDVPIMRIHLKTERVLDGGSGGLRGMIT